MGLPQHPMDQAHKRARKHHWAIGLGPRMRPRAILRGGNEFPVSSRDFEQKPVSEAHNPLVAGSSPAGPTRCCGSRNDWMKPLVGGGV